MKTIFPLLFILIALSSCTDYRKIVNSDDYDLKFKTANELFDKKKYNKSILLFEQIYQNSPKTDQGQVSYYRLAKSYYNLGDFYMAGYYFNSFIQRYPYSDKIEESLFMVAMCSVKNSPEYQLDQEETNIAINKVQQFINEYPESKLIDSCNKIIDNLRYKIEIKEFEIVKLYSKTESYKAASAAAKIFLEAYPRSKFTEEAWYILIKNSFYLSKNSINSKKKERFEQTIERYRNFASLFSNSSYLLELDFVETESQKELNLLTKSKLEK
ncbi:MAG: outer membrane protein assembly factor BamD [Bacteroidota bacterium]